MDAIDMRGDGWTYQRRSSINVYLSIIYKVAARNPLCHERICRGA